LAFKIATDPFVGSLAFIKVYSGTLHCRKLCAEYRNRQKGTHFTHHADACQQAEPTYSRLKQVTLLHVVGFKEVSTGDTLCDEKHPIVLESITFPEPVISIAVEPKTQDDVDKLDQLH
jgi:elongation factor G